ncbi:MAG TPA: lipoprotein insertase outer membrane protein LolB [Rhodanobacteraceae bacterium]|nr:lipoprotein insertase outer membrane protein LolB [Rhodanobacteraceae bacterium]
MSAPAAFRARRRRISGVRLSCAAAVAIMLAGCAAPRVKPDASLLARQHEREVALAAQSSWELAGRLGVSNGKDGASGSLDWHQDADAYRFSVHAPVTGKTWVLRGDAHRAVLEGLRDQPVEGGDAAALLLRELGWHVPIAKLTDWVRAARASGEAAIEFRGDGLPASIRQDGWTIEYPDYDTTHAPPLPRRIFASRGDYRVRLSVSEWR